MTVRSHEPGRRGIAVAARKAGLAGALAETRSMVRKNHVGVVRFAHAGADPANRCEPIGAVHQWLSRGALLGIELPGASNQLPERPDRSAKLK